MNELNSEFKCEWCGSKTEYRIQGSCQGTFCTNPSCSWSVVTTYLPEFARDKILYKMYLIPIGSSSKSCIQFLSKVLNCNFLEARRFLESNEIYLGEGLATEVLKTNKLAIEFGVSIEVKPECLHLKG